MSKRNVDHIIKIMFIGDSNVGKTSIVNTYNEKPFEESRLHTIGVDFIHKTLEINQKKVKLQIWDTAGQERFHSICASFYRGAMGIIMVYDITNADSFQNISKWLRNIEENADENVFKMILANKSDLEAIRVIPTCHGEELAKKFNIPFFEVSAKENTNISQAINSMARDIVSEKFPSIEDKSTSQNLPAEENLRYKTLNLKFNEIIKNKQSSCCF